MSNREQIKQKLKEAMITAKRREILYADWPQIRKSLLSFLKSPPSDPPSASPGPPPLHILVAGGCKSRLSEHLYNADETFDTVLDKGRLDALMELHLGPELGDLYIFEVKRVLQKGGRFICLTLGTYHVVGRFFQKFRHGWRVSVHALPQNPPSMPSVQTFMIVAEKESSSMLHNISLSFDPITLPCRDIDIRIAFRLYEVVGLLKAITVENKYREYLYSHVELLEPEMRGPEIPFGVANDIKHCNIIHQVTSSLTGPIIVDEVVYEKVADIFLDTSEELVFRRLIFPSSQNWVQSQVLLKRKEHLKDACKCDVSLICDSSDGPKFDHDYLVKATIIGLGAGMLPMFLQKCLPFFEIEVLELDPVVPGLARDFFGFKEDEHLMVHVADGFQCIRDAGMPKAVGKMKAIFKHLDASCFAGPSVSCESSLKPIEAGECSNRVDILIVDVDSSDSSSKMVCPAAEFVEESFLIFVNDFIGDQGMFIINLFSCSAPMKNLVISRMKTVFLYLYSFQIEEDGHEIIYALNAKIGTDPQAASDKLKKLLNLDNSVTATHIIDGIHKIRILE